MGWLILKSDAVKEILKLKKRDAGADTKKTESRIDSLVFKLYGISVEDEKIILNEVD
ncbi:type II restriction endonuclease [Candidatus Micrarchaeota archaeon]|nr:type II restriction endonuclease [Candidatus Micrarchaeota archaeon]